MYSTRGWATTGGAAILHRMDRFHPIKHKGIKQQGHNWAALHIQLERDQELNIVTSYVKHAWETDIISTLNQFQDYLGIFTLPWVWGGR